jgi:hypothetical protein
MPASQKAEFASALYTGCCGAVRQPCTRQRTPVKALPRWCTLYGSRGAGGVSWQRTVGRLPACVKPIHGIVLWRKRISIMGLIGSGRWLFRCGGMWPLCLAAPDPAPSMPRIRVHPLHGPPLAIAQVHVATVADLHVVSAADERCLQPAADDRLVLHVNCCLRTVCPCAAVVLPPVPRCCHLLCYECVCSSHFRHSALLRKRWPRPCRSALRCSCRHKLIV